MAFKTHIFTVEKDPWTFPQKMWITVKPRPWTYLFAGVSAVCLKNYHT